MKDAAQPDRVEGFLRAPLAATLYDSCLITEHSYSGRASKGLISTHSVNIHITISRYNSFKNGWYVKSKFGGIYRLFCSYFFVQNLPSTFHISPSKLLSLPRWSEHQNVLVPKTSLPGSNTHRYVLV